MEFLSRFLACGSALAPGSFVLWVPALIPPAPFSQFWEKGENNLKAEVASVRRTNLVTCSPFSQNWEKGAGGMRAGTPKTNKPGARTGKPPTQEPLTRNQFRYSLATVLALLCLTTTLPQTAHAQTLINRDAYRFISGTGNKIFLGVAVLRPLFTEGKNGRTQALRVADALLTSAVFSESLKHLIREKRPDTDERNSFPSGHATAAFAVATMQSHYHPNEAFLWYGGAALIGLSRVELNRHYVHDVLAGMVLGVFTARWEISRSRGLVLSPFIRRENGESGVKLQARF